MFSGLNGLHESLRDVIKLKAVDFGKQREAPMAFGPLTCPVFLTALSQLYGRV